MSSFFNTDDVQQDAPRQYLTFTLADEMFAVSTFNVREIIEYGQLTTVPMLPPSVLGVINLRGSVVPIMDLRQRFGAGQTPIGRRTCIIILELTREGQHQVMGVVVEAVNAVIEISAQDIEPPPNFGARLRTDFIHGMAKLEGQLVVLLEIGKVLSLDDLRLLSDVQLATDMPQTA
ncbi:chemotaxis protein CheW [Pseudomonas protegens]|uniref:chemotaxis protein CheW n=1 Tax=Pseudomonas protegens TaxID=380021 RepID=UPI0018EB1FB2|nr:chemotaxis protein CheW [Pseudomonas protegens]MDP9529215.1 chemotaxis protein CheW [Pseudomonas protegens]